MHLSLSVEDTNKLRARLGLKLIPITTEHNETNINERIATIKSKTLKSKENELIKKDIQTPSSSNIKEFNHTEETDRAALETTDTWLTMISKISENQKDAQKQENTNNISNTDNQSSLLPDNTAKSVKRANTTTTVESAPLPKKRLTNEKSDPKFDPLDRVEVHVLPEKTVAPKKATFKTKKITSNSSKREKKSTSSISAAHSEITKKDDEYYKMLLDSAAKKKSHSGNVMHQGSRHINGRATQNVVDTSEFLERVKMETNNTDKNNKENDSTVDTDNKINEDKLGEGVEASNEVSSDETATKPLSVAETLSILRSKMERSNSQPLSKATVNRSWAKKLLTQRQHREAERREFEAKIKNLPPKDREEAINLFKKRMNDDMTQEAQIINENYVPDVIIQHQDKKGNIITPKEAFKNISKSFHEHKRK